MSFERKGPGMEDMLRVMVFGFRERYGIGEDDEI